MWVLISLAAGTLQTARNGLARSLSGALPVSLLSWSRFAFNLPFAATLALGLYLFGSVGLPNLSLWFFTLCLIGGIGQLLGNIVLIKSFALSTFAQSIVVHKTEVALAALTGLLFFSQLPSLISWVGIGISALGVAMIGFATAKSKDSEGSVSFRTLLRTNGGSALALLSAMLLVVAGFGISLATDELRVLNPSVDGTFMLAATTLVHVTWIEVVILTGWIAYANPTHFAMVRPNVRRLAAIGFTSFGGSLGWFWAFSMSFVAYVKAVGQIESVLSVLLAIYVWKEQSTKDQLPGIALTIIGILFVVLG